MKERRQILQIRDQHGPFKWDPQPDGVNRTKKPPMTLDNGAEYEGEWDD